MSDYKYTVRADWLDPITNAIGNLFEDIRGAQLLLEQGRGKEAEREADEAVARFNEVALEHGADVEHAGAFVDLSRVKCKIYVTHPNGGEIRITYSPRLV